MNTKKLRALMKQMNELLDELADNKAPRTGFPKPTEKEKKEFTQILTDENLRIAINALKKAKPLEPVRYFNLENLEFADEVGQQIPSIIDKFSGMPKDKFLGKSVGDFIKAVDKKRIANMFQCKKCKCKKVRSSRGLVCPKHEIKN